MCLRGASEVSKVTVEEGAGSDLTSYVVWVPMLFGRESHVPEATSVVVDERTRHYWDGAGLLMSGYRRVLSLSVPAWDIYMVFGRDARWDQDEPPTPELWMHQLRAGAKQGPYLDVAVFGATVRRLLEDGRGG